MSKQSAYFRVPDLAGGHDSKQIKAALDRISGVISVSVSTGAHKVAVDYDSSGTSCDAIQRELDRTGYPAQLLETQDHTM